MSDTDSFIREVTEEVRQDRMLRYWKRYGPWVAGALALIVAAAAGWAWLDAQARQQARATGGQFLATEPGDAQAAAELVGSVEGPAGLVARLRHAGALTASGDTEGAIAAYEQAAAAEAPAAYTDLAALSALRLAAPTLPVEEALSRLAPLTAEGAPYRPLALELAAVLRLNAGETAAAHDDLRAILDSPRLTGGLEQRARALLAATGGDAEAATN
mgnify:CR=1 FL=1